MKEKIQGFLDRLRQLIVSFVEFLRSSRKNLILIIAVAAATLLVSTVTFHLLNRAYNLHIPSLSTIRTLGVEAYWDNHTQNKVELIDWGTLWLGSSNNITIYLLSVSDTDTTLELTGENLTFYNTSKIAIHLQEDISTNLTLSWDYNGTILKPGSIIQVTLTLESKYSPDFAKYIIEEDIESFNLDIVIRTNQYIT